MAKKLTPAQRRALEALAKAGEVTLKQWEFGMKIYAHTDRLLRRRGLVRARYAGFYSNEATVVYITDAGRAALAADTNDTNDTNEKASE